MVSLPSPELASVRIQELLRLGFDVRQKANTSRPRTVAYVVHFRGGEHNEDELEVEFELTHEQALSWLNGHNVLGTYQCWMVGFPAPSVERIEQLLRVIGVEDPSRDAGYLRGQPTPPTRRGGFVTETAPSIRPPRAPHRATPHGVSRSREAPSQFLRQVQHLAQSMLPRVANEMGSELSDDALLSELYQSPPQLESMDLREVSVTAELPPDDVPSLPPPEEEKAAQKRFEPGRRLDL